MLPNHQNAFMRAMALSLTVALTAAGPAGCAAVPAGAGSVSTAARIANHADAGQAGSLAAAISQAKADPAVELEVVLPGPHHYVIGTDFEIPRNVTLSVRRGAILEISEGVTLTINGGLEAGPWRVFAGPGRVAGTPDVDFVRPQWWGTDAAAVQAAVAFRRVHLGRGQFTLDSRILIGSDTHITGEPECLLTNTRKGLNLAEGVFTNWPPEGKGKSVRNVTVDGVRFKNTSSTGLFALALFAEEAETTEKEYQDRLHR